MWSNVIPIVLGVLVTALILWSGRASHPRRTARFDTRTRRPIGPVAPTKPDEPPPPR